MDKMVSSVESLDLKKYLDKAGVDTIKSEQIRMDVKSFFTERTGYLSKGSLRHEMYGLKMLVKFLSEKSADEDLANASEEDECRACEKWLLKNGYKIYSEKMRDGKVRREQCANIRYYRQFLIFIDKRSGRYGEDVWELSQIGFEVEQNPSTVVKRLFFKQIKQKEIREEVKAAIRLLLTGQKAITAREELAVMRRFSAFLDKEYPDVVSMREINRDIMEEYQINIKTNQTKKSLHSEMIHLKTCLDTIRRIYDYKNLQQIILPSDLPKQAKVLYRSYSDAEIMRLNSAIARADPQSGRAWILQELLGTRISEVLSLTLDSIVSDREVYIQQGKTAKGYKKLVSEDVIKLIRKAGEYTKEKFGTTKYIFVADRDPNRPMPYGTLRGRIKKIIIDCDLRDDTGQLFGVRTHFLRHAYGRRLAELGFDDVTIAQLLGHRSLGAVQNYRKLSKEHLAEETKVFRDNKDEILKRIVGGW